MHGWQTHQGGPLEPWAVAEVGQAGREHCVGRGMGQVLHKQGPLCCMFPHQPAQAAKPQLTKRR